MRSMVSMTMGTSPEINCSAECKRDLLCSFVLLIVTMVPPIQSLEVVLCYDGYNKTLVPIDVTTGKTTVTHTLRRATPDDYKYHQLAAKTKAKDIDVVVSCPAGYFLLAEQKICAICSANTWSSNNDNTCFPCPQDAESEPGASECLPRKRPTRSCRWHWLLYFYAVLASSAVCLASAFAIMLRRHFRQPSNVRFAGNFGSTGYGNRYKRRKSDKRSPRRHVSAPSRVLLNELLRASSSSTSMTDMQDYDGKLWKAKSTPPPLPPIDF